MAIDQRSAHSLTDLHLRPALAEDLPALVSLHAQLDASPWGLDQWSSCLLPPFSVWVLVTADAGVVAYSAWMAAAEDVELLAMGVTQQRQQQGIGAAFLQAVFHLLPDCTECCFLEVRQSNLPAINLYTKLGFEPVGERRDYYAMAGGGRENAIIMKYQLPKQS